MTSVRRPNVDIESLAEGQTTRRFSKRITIANLGILAGLAGYGMWTAHPDTAGIVASYGMWSFGGIAMYMHVGQQDYRTSKGMPSFVDVLTLLVTKGRSGRRDMHEGGLE